MSDTDNESAFESADEGEEELHEEAEAVEQQVSISEPGTSSVTYPKKQEAVESMQAGVASAIKSKDPVNQSDLCPSEEVSCDSKADSAECALDEGLGDWDAGWEVDEDVLACVSPSTNTAALNISASTPTTQNKQEKPLSDVSDELESQCVSVPFQKMETALRPKERGALDSLSEENEKSHTQSTGWGWGGWGTSFLSTATSSVTTFTSQVGSGLNSVLESVEATLGAPSPEELAVEHLTVKESQRKAQQESSTTCSSDELKGHPHTFFGSSLSVGSLVSGVSSLTTVLEQTSSKVITGSLDTLELIGRKTMDILQEGDPHLKKKRQFLKGDKPNLSEILREAKERDSEVKESEEPQIDNQVHFSTVFDDFQGLVHLEALEMLSKESEQKVQVALLSHFGDDLKEMQSQLDKIKELYDAETARDVDDDIPNHEFHTLVAHHLESLKLAINTDKLLETQSKAEIWLQQCITDQDKRESKDPQDIHNKAILFMAEFTARVVEIIHKACELYLVANESSVLDDIKHFASFANATCAELALQSTKYSDCLNTAADDSEKLDSISHLITNVYLEASNSSTYIQDACHLIVPIFQLKFVNRTKAQQLPLLT